MSSNSFDKKAWEERQRGKKDNFVTPEGSMYFGIDPRKTERPYPDKDSEIYKECMKVLGHYPDSKVLFPAEILGRVKARLKNVNSSFEREGRILYLAECLNKCWWRESVNAPKYCRAISVEYLTQLRIHQELDPWRR